ncbi:MAG: sigma 54-interacting transcriptional regulator [Clostridiales bacterium]|nr:sigma 54-interacting transcriptional regulator [Clostridiales bacterium]MCF8023275.1 sigma 54-interacting transcriptional regulator [Clostridiales bacterium]
MEQVCVECVLRQEDLLSALNLLEEAVVIIDNKGAIKYVNSAFANITGIVESEKIDESIYDFVGERTLTKMLETGEPIFNYHTTIIKNNIEVVSNVTPIMLNQKITGAVIVFKNYTTEKSLIDQIQENMLKIKKLNDKINQVTTSKYTFQDVHGNSKILKKSLQNAERHAKKDYNILIKGEYGTGKTLFAHAIHNISSRKNNPFLQVNCKGISERMMECELWGCTKEYYSKKHKYKVGKFEIAHGGTMFFNEISDLNIGIQQKFLNMLQKMEIEKSTDVRVIAATNRDLPKLVSEGKFSHDLYYCLSTGQVNIPSLKERKEDLSMLINNSIIKLNKKLHKKVKGLSKNAEELLHCYNWPGNVKELEDVIEKVMLKVDENFLSKDSFIQHVSQFKNVPSRDWEIIPIDEIEQIMIQKAIAKFGDSVEGKRRAARALNISLATLYNKLKKIRTTDYYR